jgi:hypothetical protein
VGEAEHLQWPALKELQWPRFEGASYWCLKRASGAD